MYNITDTTQIIYLYDQIRGGYTHKFPTLLDAIKYVASNYLVDYFTKELRNNILDDINMGQDTRNVYWDVCSYTKSQRYVRQYTFVDETDRIIDMRDYIQEALDLYKSHDIKYINLWARKINRNKIRRKAKKSWKETTKNRKQWAKHL